MLDGQSAFLAHEVGAALGIKNPRGSIRRNKAMQEGEDYALCAPKDLSSQVRSVIDSAFHPHSNLPNRLIVLFESGLYTFVLRSDKPAALKFHRWAMRVVRPIMRKQGFYGALGSELQNKIQDQRNPSHLLRLMDMAEKGNGYAKRLLHDRGFAPPVPPSQEIN